MRKIITILGYDNNYEPQIRTNMKANLSNWTVKLSIITAGASLAAAEPTLKIGDRAPALATGKWVQGDPVKEFETGKSYIVEFWATWCGPCRVSIPHLNEVHNRYKDKGLIVIGQDCWENDEKLVVPFVQKMGEKMTYRVALDDKNGSDRGKMAETWMQAAGRNGIPSAFLVDTHGVVAWIGHPMELKDSVIEDVLNGRYDVQKAAQDYADAQAKSRRLQEAWTAVNQAIRAKHWDEASTKLDDLAELLPKDNTLTCDMLRLNILLGKGDFDPAYKLMGRMSEANLKNSGLQNQLAWRLVSDKSIKQPDLALAETLANRANEAAAGKEANILDTLARVNFMLGRHDAAVAAEEKAVALAEGQQRTSYQTTLRHYQRGELPDKAQELSARAWQEGGQGKWKDALADFTSLIEMEPEEHYHYHGLGAVLVQLGDSEGYERFRQNVIKQFGSTQDPMIAERMVKTSLILPCARPALETFNKMADTSVTLGKDHGYFLYFEFAKALAEYRSGRFENAIDWCQRVLDAKGEGVRECQTCLVLAMAQYHLQHADAARPALAKGRDLLGKLPRMDSGDLGPDFNDIVIANALMHEASATEEASQKVAKE